MKYSEVNDHDRPWYAVKSLFFDEDNKLYEERTIILSAESQEQALDKAQKEAEQYASDVGVQYKGYSETFHLFDETLDDGVEIFSVMRPSKLDANAYIKHFIATGEEIGIERELK